MKKSTDVHNIFFIKLYLYLIPKQKKAHYKTEQNLFCYYCIEQKLEPSHKGTEY